MEKDFEELMMTLGSIFYYGNFKAETPNELKVQKMLEKYGFFFKTEDEVIEKRRNLTLNEPDLTKQAVKSEEPSKES